MNDAPVQGLGPLAQGWQMLRLAARHPPAAPGQWLELDLQGQSLRLPVLEQHAEWTALLLPPALARKLPELRPGSPCRVNGPLGPAAPAAPVLLADEVGLAAALHAARRQNPPPRLVLIGAADSLPFRPRPSRYLIGPKPAEAIAGIAMLEELGIPSRIAHPDGLPGCFEGDAVGLLRRWWGGLETKPDVRVLALGGEKLRRRLDEEAEGLPQYVFQPIPAP
ncbi:hypothetical protein [Alkalilimnicola sp. S0819]|uniref:hypothetical protein n=1 Tax=Alkalilimnicola sp. S0819 TaxID=2613922 RepID=UPI001261C33A|nr:hypothetical protein [Alkalilimnicola sp. S0819]KAB7624459.1 hypothetical protein F3N43_06555 [Alkalilimnicola sp. S0819]MPQ16294.1 hypothetical protein [Alkalilimnicola sp. S0819]